MPEPHAVIVVHILWRIAWTDSDGVRHHRTYATEREAVTRLIRLFKGLGSEAELTWQREEVKVLALPALARS